MASDFDTLYAQTALPNFHDWFGEAITYTVDGAVTAIASAIVDDQQAEDQTREDGRVQIGWLAVSINRDADSAAGGVADPRLDAILTIRGDRYAVDAITGQNANFTTLRVIRVESIEKSRQGYRTQGYRTQGYRP